MTIGIDIDDTITNTSELIKDAMIRNHIYEYTGDYNNMSFEEMEKYRHLFEKYIEDVLTNCTIKDNCSEVIKRLKEKGNKIILITARNNYYSKNVMDITKKYLKDHNVIYDEILFDYGEKLNICKEKKLDVMIDDNYKLYLKLLDTSIKPVLFETEYNKDYKDYIRIKNWLDLEKMINDMEVSNGR